MSIYSVFMPVLSVVDVYAKLILTSWPAVALIFGLLILFRHRNAIDILFRRIIKIGKDGIGLASPLEEQKEVEKTVSVFKRELEKLQRDRVEAEKDARAIQNQQAQIAALLNQISQLQGALVQEGKQRLYERIYGSIFGGQLYLLIRLEALGKIPYAEAFDIYNLLLPKYPDLKSTDAHRYATFLIDVGFVEAGFENNTDILIIKEEGRNFLKYLREQKLTFEKPF